MPRDHRSSGSKGGAETFRRYGPKHMAEIGKKGFASLVARYFGGDASAAKDWLHLQAAERKIDHLVTEKLASGEETCVELPVLLDPEDDPTFEEPPSWRDRVKASGSLAYPKAKSGHDNAYKR
ncbi:MAG: hypothetical protein AB7I30_09145 [Isosphaeraceae bacterium]